MKKIFILLCAAAVAVSCGQRTKKSAEKEDGGTPAPTAAVRDTTRIAVDTAALDTVLVIFAEENDDRYFGAETAGQLLERLSSALYDTQWNDTGIMVKMVTPDYTLVFIYKNKSADENDWMSIWKEGGRIKFNDKWFLLPQTDMEAVSSLLDGLRAEE